MVATPHFTVDEIIGEIPHFTFAERVRLAQALGVKYDAWDLQMVEDSKSGGKLDILGKEALAAHRRGECEPWP